MTLNSVLIDTNICFDVILNRKPFATVSAEIIERCETGAFTGIMAAHSFDTIFYILNNKLGKKKAYQGIAYVREVFDVSAVTQEVIDKALQLKWSDFEDAIHYQAAVEAGCDALVSRSEKDFKNANLPVFSPHQFLKELKEK